MKKLVADKDVNWDYVRVGCKGKDEALMMVEGRKTVLSLLTLGPILV